MTQTAVPTGFEPHFRQSPATNPWEPLYSRRSETAVIIGLHLALPHTNSRGFAHGGVVTALADNAMGLSCGLALARGLSLLTISLAVDFLGVARIGQWLSFETDFIRTGTTLSFAQCFVKADGTVCARANASFRTVDLTKVK